MRCQGENCGKKLTSKNKKIFAYIDGKTVVFCEECANKKLNFPKPEKIEKKGS